MIVATALAAEVIVVGLLIAVDIKLFLSFPVKTIPADRSPTRSSLTG